MSYITEPLAAAGTATESAGVEPSLLKQSDITFAVTPAEIIFRNYGDLRKCEATISFRNQTTTVQYIRLMKPDSRFFELSEPRAGKIALKVAAGLSLSYSIYFYPEKDQDYEYDFVAFTDHERFIIPVRALGSRGRLELPSIVKFGDSPIKGTSKNTILLSNSGSKPCDWFAIMTPPFALIPSCGLLAPGAQQQVTVEFSPGKLMRYESSILFDLGHGESQTMKVEGVGVNVDIVLESDVLEIPKTFISLERQVVISVYNRSGVMVDYAWKEHATDEQEAQARQFKLESAKDIMTNNELLLLSITKNNDNTSNMDNLYNQTNSLAAKAAYNRLISTKLTEIDAQPLYYNGDVFTIEPLYGSIPARCKRELTVTFNPQLELQYVSTAYLDIQGQNDRIPLTIKGIGLGPCCALGFDNLDLGDIIINSLHQYEVVLENRSAIEAKWMFQPQNTLFGPKFKFLPSHGILPVGTLQTIQIAFFSDIIGIISEVFSIRIQGPKEELKLHFKGRVIGPTFHFDADELDFGNVSYNFWYTKVFTIFNTSESPMNFILRVPEDASLSERKEFDIIPNKGLILPHGQQKIQVDFLSNTVQEYNSHLVIDLEDVGENLDSLPIKATCLVPPISLSHEGVDFGTCFISYPYSQEVELKNDTALCAKYEVILPADGDPLCKNALISVGTGDAAEKRGVVRARSVQRISITLIATAIGTLHTPIYIRILGSEGEAHLIYLSAKVIGPQVDLLPTILDFGTLNLLTEHVKPITIVNNTPIPAPYQVKLTLRTPSHYMPPFIIDELPSSIPPNSTSYIQVKALLDEAMKFTDEAVITIEHNPNPLKVKLVAKGKGFVLIPSIPLDVVDFGDQFTTVKMQRTFILQNRGRRAQQIQWANERGSKLKEGDPPIVFTITPERIEIPGKSEASFTIEGLSDIKGVFCDKFALTQSSTRKMILKSTVQGSFQVPLLSYSTTEILFKYVYQTMADVKSVTANCVFTRKLSMRNTSPLPVTVGLGLGKPSSSNEPGPQGNPNARPFVIDNTDFTLQSGETATITIQFDAGYRGDRVSHSTKVRMAVGFANHPQKASVMLLAEVNFPNLLLSNNDIDFGCILNDTEQHQTFTLTNPSSIPASYTWVFEGENANPAIKRSSAGSKVSSADIYIPINNVFDIVPFRGVVAPGATEITKVVFNGISGRKFNATATCQVEGGPTYDLRLKGESSAISYRFDKVVLDFESQDFDKWTEKEIYIYNTSKVFYPFRVDLSTLSCPGVVEVSPMTGVITEKVKLMVKFCPRVPDDVNERFKVFVAHFDPQVIDVRGHGSYSSLQISAVGTANDIVRVPPPGFEAYYNKVKEWLTDITYHPYTYLSPAPVNRCSIDLAAVEAERLVFRDLIVEDMLQQRAAATGAAPETNAQRVPAIKRSIGNRASVYILSSHILDVGHVVKGDVKKNNFRITNTSLVPILLNVDRRNLKDSAISFHPDKFNKLNVYGSIVVEVAFNTKLHNVEIGYFSQEVLFEIKGGSLISITVKANVILPQIKLSTDHLDFGIVLTGMTRIIPVMIENTQPLPCDWKAIFPRDKKYGRRPLLSCKPERGSLNPDQGIIIEVAYAPLSNEKMQQHFGIYINMNPTAYDLTCTGTGEELNVVCDCPSLELDPVFPLMVSRTGFKLINNSSVPVEVYNHEFDKKYLIEEEILRNASECFVNDVLLLPPREVNSSLPDNLMESYYRKLIKIEAALAAEDFVPADDDMAKPANVMSNLAPYNNNNSINSILTENVHVLTPREETHEGAADNISNKGSTKESVKPVLIVITGPALSGKTTQVRLLCEQFGYLRVSLDDIVEQAMESDSENGEALHAIYERQLAAPKETRLHLMPVPPDAKISKAEQLKMHQLTVEEAAKYEVPLPLLTTTFLDRLKQNDVMDAGGLVLDDLGCRLTNNAETMFRAVKEATQQIGFSLLVIDLSMDALLSELRRATEALEAAEGSARVNVIRQLREEEYDRLTMTEQRKYDYALKRKRDSKRLLEQAHKIYEDALRKRRQEQEDGTLCTLQQEVEQLTAAKEAVETEAKQKKGATKKAKDHQAAAQVIDWDELKGSERYRKIYELLKQTFDSSIYKSVSADESLEKVQEQILLTCRTSGMVSDTVSLTATGKDNIQKDVPTTVGGTEHSSSLLEKKLVNKILESEGGTSSLIAMAPGRGGSLQNLAGMNSAGGQEIRNEMRKMQIPPPITLQRIDRPKEKRAVKRPRYFKILTPVLIDTGTKEGKRSKPAGGASLIAAQQGQQEQYKEITRWIIPPDSAQELMVEFYAGNIATHHVNLHFGIVGSTQQINLECNASTSYPNIFRDVRAFFSKTAHALALKHVRKAYIQSQRTYNFGSLLVPLAALQASQSLKKGNKEVKVFDFKNSNEMNMESMKLVNSGSFPAQVKFFFENPLETTFVLEKSMIDLDISESGKVNLMALPDTIGEVKNTVILCIKDNPEPLAIGLRCYGTVPVMTLNDSKELVVDFGRMVVKKQEQRQIILKSGCLLPILWRITNAEQIPVETKFDSKGGIIDAEKSTKLTINFSSERANILNVPLKIEVLDVDGETVYEKLSLTVMAEAYDVIIEWTKELDFGTIRVGESKTEMIRILNKGPYQVDYCFKMPPMMEEVITLNPVEGVARGVNGFKDAAVCNIEATFKSELKEFMIGTRRTGDLELHILDVETKALIMPPQMITLKGEALNNRYNIKPRRINFGACLYRQKKTAHFEITNSGVFEIKYHMYNYKTGFAAGGGGSGGATTNAQSPDQYGKKKVSEKKMKKGHEQDTMEFLLNVFGISPNNGSIAPGATTIFTVILSPEGNATFKETLGIYVESDSGPESDVGTPFELEAESCIPGIVADLDSPESDIIFEEQQILPRLDRGRKTAHIYAREEKCLSFGLALTGSKQAERLRLTNPNKVPCTVNLAIVPRGDAPDARQAAEGFEILESKTCGGKITIPMKEYRYVTVAFIPLCMNNSSAYFEATVEGGLDPKTRQLKLELRGEGSLPSIAVDIPSPPQVAQDVPLGIDAKTKIKVAQKLAKKEENQDYPANTLVLSRTIVGKTSKSYITVRNVGDLPATIRFSLSQFIHNQGIVFPRRGENITLASGAVEPFSVLFEPVALGITTVKLNISLQDNPYEDMSVQIYGEGYFEPIIFEQIDENTENRLSMNDCYVNVPKERSFNITSNAHYGIHYEWKCDNSAITLSPMVGHLPPLSSASINATYCGSAPVAAISVCACTLQALNEPVQTAWNCNQIITKWKQQESATIKKPVDGGSADVTFATAEIVRPQMICVKEAVPEPAYTVKETLAGKNLLVSYVCDYTHWELQLDSEALPVIQHSSKDKKDTKVDSKKKPASRAGDDKENTSIVGSTKSLLFSLTKLLQSRKAVILLKNIGNVSLPYTFKVDGAVNSDGDDHTVEDDAIFTIDPSRSLLKPGKTEHLQVSYTPQTTGMHFRRLVGSFPYGSNSEAIVPLVGSAECPLIHFELPQKDWPLMPCRDNRPPISADQSVIEFFGKGVNVHNCTRFMANNPSNISYDFVWVEKTPVSQFKCMTIKGSIHSGKKYEMFFDFAPETLETLQSEWEFRIPIHDIVVPFLLLGHAMEPEVFFSQSHVDMGHVIVGAKGVNTITIENRENISYPFAFQLLHNSDIRFSPTSGVVPANGSVPINIIFTPKTEDPYNITLTCIVQNAVSPLTCNIKGEGYMTHESLKILQSNGILASLSPSSVNAIQLPITQVNGKVVKKFVLSNEGRYNFDYKWNCGKNTAVKMTKIVGTVPASGVVEMEATYAPTREGKLVDYKMVCQISNGFAYTVVLNAIAANPLVSFSWTCFDFGPRFLSYMTLEPAFTFLSATNNDVVPVAIDTSFDNKDYLDLDVNSFVLYPSETRDVKVSFNPRDTMTYREEIPFTINDLTKVTIVVLGEGTTPTLDISPRCLRFGPTEVNNGKELDVRVMCKSNIPTFFSLEGCISEEMVKAGFSVGNGNPLWLKPRETRIVKIRYFPTGRQRPFSYEVKMLMLGKEYPFVTVSGSGLGPEVFLDQKTISFGNVVAGTKVVRKISILNSGDCDMEFVWNEAKLGSDYSIRPVRGVTPSHSETKCEITYQPTEPGGDDKRVTEISFGNELVPSTPLQIIQTACVDRPSLTDILTFECRVRETVTQMVSIKNDTSDTWVIRPNISNILWTCPESIQIKPHEQGIVSLTYKPIISTQNKADQKCDTGTLFLALPNGSALLYRLEGMAESPAPAGPAIEREIPTKTPYTEKFTVNNWLDLPQKFMVTQQWSHDTKDESVIIKSVPTIDVPATGKREYKLTFMSYLEGKYKGTITFINENTKEYQYYTVTFNVKATKEYGSFELQTPCRVRATKEITLTNPLNKNVILISKCDNPDIIVPPTVMVPAKSDIKVPIEFLPLIAKDYPLSRLTFSCPELGEFLFNAKILATPALPELPVRFSCALGQSTSTMVRFIHYSKTAMEFSFKQADPKQSAFTRSVAGAIKVPPAADSKNGSEVLVDITFEPSRIGEFKENVEFVSNTLRNYSFTLLGVCTPPRRQAPVEIKPNQTVAIPFKNVFLENCVFNFASDTHQFVVAKASDMIQSKKFASISVQYKCEDATVTARGKLTVSCTPSAEVASGPLTWIYYLKGMKEGEQPTQSLTAERKSDKSDRKKK